MKSFDRVMDKVVLAMPQMRTRVSAEEVQFVVRLTCRKRAKKYPVLMRDRAVIRLLESEVMDAVKGKMFTHRQRIDVFGAIFSRAERNPIFTLHRAHMQEAEQ